MNETKQIFNDAVFDLQDALNAPLITFDTSWADTIPKRIKDLILLERMRLLMLKQYTATLPEVVAYLYTRICIAPMSGDWTDIYCNVSCAVLRKHYNEDHRHEVRGHALTSWQMDKLRRLRSNIYQKRRKVLKERLKQVKQTI